MKYLYTPFDVALYIWTSNLTITQEYFVIDSLWERRDTEIWHLYSKDKKTFVNSMYHELYIMEGYLGNADELNLIFQEMGSKFNVGETNFEQGVIESYFKLIKLKLTYTPNIDYCKIKLRNLIGRFGYKRRTKSLVECIERTTNALGLKVYLRGWEYCNIATVALDDMIIIRGKNTVFFRE